MEKTGSRTQAVVLLLFIFMLLPVLAGAVDDTAAVKPNTRVFTGKDFTYLNSGFLPQPVTPFIPGKEDYSITDPLTGEKKEPIDCSGDYLEYDEADGNIYARGNVVVKYKDIILKADEIRMSTKSEEVEANGHIYLTEADNIIKGDHIKYNLKAKLGTVDNIEYFKKPWFFKAKQIERPDEQNANMRESITTTCDNHEHPHYRLVSGRIHLLIDEKVECWDTVVYIGDIPIFYLPYFFKNFKTGNSPLSLNPGYSSFEGAYLKCAYNYELTADLTGSLLLDFMSVKGIGYGLKQNYNLPGLNGGGNVYAYYIQEADTGHARGHFTLSHQSDIVKDLRVIANIDYLSDQDLLSDFYPGYYYGLQSYITSNIAFSKRDDAYTASLAFTRYDSWNGASGAYTLSNATAPAIQFNTTTPIQLGVQNFTGAFSANATRTYVPGGDYYNTRYTVSPAANYTYAYMPGNTLGATLTFNGIWAEMADPGVDNQGLTASASETVNVHNSWNPHVTTDFSHTLYQNLTRVSGDPNNGTATNKLNGSLSFAADRFTLTLGTGFDLRGNIMSTVLALEPYTLALRDEVKARFDPLNTHFSVLFTDTSDASLDLQYRLYDDRLLYAATSFGFNRGQQFTYGLGANYSSNFPYDSILDISGNISFNVNDDLRIEASAVVDTVSRKFRSNTAKFIFNLTDCIAMDITYMKTQISHSVGFNIYMRAFTKTELDRQPPEVNKH